MNNLENLDQRVETAVQKFHQSEELRRSENKSLSRILNDLETKFEARTAELEDCELRIAELEDSNVSLNALVCQLVDIVEKSADEITQDPLYRASAAASDIVSRYVAETSSNEEAGPPVAPQTVPAGSVEQGPPVAPAEETLSAGSFEDIGADFLRAEEIVEKTDGASEFPKLVFDAIAMARGEQVPEPADQPADQPAANIKEDVEPEAVQETVEREDKSLNDGDLDIKEIMARLEIAAERAQLRADHDAKRDRGQLESEVLEQAVGGRA